MPEAPFRPDRVKMGRLSFWRGEPGDVVVVQLSQNEQPGSPVTFKESFTEKDFREMYAKLKIRAEAPKK